MFKNAKHRKFIKCEMWNVIFMWYTVFRPRTSKNMQYTYAIIAFHFSNHHQMCTHIRLIDNAHQKRLDSIYYYCLLFYSFFDSFFPAECRNGLFDTIWMCLCLLLLFIAHKNRQRLIFFSFSPSSTIEMNMLSYRWYSSFGWCSIDFNIILETKTHKSK